MRSINMRLPKQRLGHTNCPLVSFVKSETKEKKGENMILDWAVVLSRGFRAHRAIAIGCVVCMVFIGAASGAAFVLKAVRTYSGACETLAGVPGILQAALFIPKGNCDFGDADDPNADPKPNHKCPPSACSVDGHKGTCGPDNSDPPVLCQRHHKPVCVCIVGKESRDEDKH